MRARYFLGAVLALLPVAASASETITYGYDAKGRLVTVAHNGAVNAGVVAAYSFDKADNRTNASVSGSPYSGPVQQVIVTPIGGMKVIPLPAAGF